MIHSLGLWPFGTLLHPLLHLLLRGRGAAATCVAETPVKNSLLLTNEETGKSLNTLVLQRSSCGSGQLSQPSFSWSSGEGNCTGWIYGLIVMCQPCSCHLPCWSPWQFLPKWNICGDLMDRHVAEGRRNSFYILEPPAISARLGGGREGRKRKGELIIIVQLLSHVHLFVTPRIAACQASLSFTISRNLLKLMSIESEMPSNPILSLSHLSSCLQSCPESDG